jgi:hypothetical protein
MVIIFAFNDIAAQRVAARMQPVRGTRDRSKVDARAVNAAVRATQAQARGVRDVATEICRCHHTCMPTAQCFHTSSALHKWRVQKQI